MHSFLEGNQNNLIGKQLNVLKKIGVL